MNGERWQWSWHFEQLGSEERHDGAMTMEQQLVEALACIVENAKLLPDPAMAGATDVYAVPLGDIERACELLRSMVP